MGIFLSLRVLDWPDLTVNSSLVSGAAAAAMAMNAGWSPWLTLPAAIAAGCMAGVLVALLHNLLRIERILAGVIGMMAVYSLNLVVMGRPNISLLHRDTLLSSLPSAGDASVWLRAGVLFLIAAVVAAGVLLVLRSQPGLVLRGCGDNERLLAALGRRPAMARLAGMAASNGLAGLSGCLLVQDGFLRREHGDRHAGGGSRR